VSENEAPPPSAQPGAESEESVERVIGLPEFSLVVLVGPSGSGKSTFARRHFLPTEVLSSDVCRGLVSDDENDQSATKDAFELLHFIAAKRLAARRLTVIDATNVQREARKPLIRLAREYHCLPVVVAFRIPEGVCHDRNKARDDRDFGPRVIRQQSSEMKRSLRGLKREGFRHVNILRSPEEVDAVRIERRPLWTDRRGELGPFDIIGDVHGCADELRSLLEELGWELTDGEDGRAVRARHPQGRRAIFVGDLVDRGPQTPAVLRLAMNMVEDGTAFCVPGNHDVKLARKLRGRNVQIRHGLAESLEQLEAESDAFREQAASFLDGLVSHFVLDGGKLVVAHAGMKEELQGRASGKVREFALYGETTGETDEFGLPERIDWAAEYRGRAMVVYGHTPVEEACWLNRTINIDTGCVFGGKLTALRYPEKELVSVPCRQVWAEPAKPLRPVTADSRSPQQQHDDLLDLDDVRGKRLVATRLHHNVTVRAENAAAALEVMSRFAIDPRWLIYLPPTMSPSGTSSRDGYLEHPDESFEYFAGERVESVVCEEKHMGSRVVVIVCRDHEAVRRRFGVDDGRLGVCFTRTGRSFFVDDALQAQLVDIVRGALAASGFWDDFATDWVCLDCELMPWSAKAQSLITQQYAAVGAASREALSSVLDALDRAAAGNDAARPYLDDYRERSDQAAGYRRAYRAYCWPVESIADLRLAPFHVLATEGGVHHDRDHAWHMETIAGVCAAADGVLWSTPYRVVELGDETSRADAVRWWEELTGTGGEGMVVKPSAFVSRGRRGLVQPAVKCRGREYLRIIYGPEYTRDRHLSRLRSRRLGRKRSLALREFALGIEALERFVAGEPLRRVHECVFGVLALESEPVDPRL